MICCCNCGKEMDHTFVGDPYTPGKVYCELCAGKIKSAISDITPEEFEAYLMTNWRSLTRNRWEVELPGVDGSGEDHGKTCG